MSNISKYVAAPTLLFLWWSTISSAQTNCYNTSQLAIDPAIASSSSPLSKSGYRLSRIQSDPALGKRWAMIVSCDHPEWPAFALPLEINSPLKASQRISTQETASAPVVHAGDVVQLWRYDRLLRIEVTGISEESGSLGKKIRVRLVQRDSGVPQQLLGVVRGPSNVEIEP
jgi:flagella basal body P-ring formation protein FlgA